MAKVCEMIVNRDYIRENNAGHPPRTSHRAYVSSAGVYAPRARTWIYVCMRMHAYVCVCGRDAFTHVCGKKRPGARAGGRGREDVDIFLRATRECRERHAFDWPRVVGAAAGDHGTRMRGEGDSGAWRRWQRVARVVHPLPSIFRGFFLRATALACLDERTRGGTSIIYNQTADKATIALL